MRRTNFLASALALTLLLLTPPLVSAQYLRFEAPADSPHWWTLSDEITPSELRHALVNRDANLARLRESLAAGRVPGPPADQLAKLQVHLDGRVWPELVPMWDAFDAYALRFESRDDWETRSAELLAEYGLSAEGVETVNRIGKEHRQREVEIIERLGPRQRELVQIQRDAQRRLGEERMRAATRSKDFTALARASSRSTEQVEEVYYAAQGDPSVIAGLESVVKLRAQLSEEDWDALRQYLLEDVAPILSVTSFDEEG